MDGDRVWAGTDNGLALYENGKWKVFTTADGLAHRAVLSLALDKQTHDLWIATMGGLSRYSAGRFDTFTQLNSGLAERRGLWRRGAGRFCVGRHRRGREPLEYAHGRVEPLQRAQYAHVRDLDVRRLAPAPDKVYYAVWGGGVLEYDVKTDRWKDYNDPDGENEIVLYKDQGLIHEITTSVSYVERNPVGCHLLRSEPL